MQHVLAARTIVGQGDTTLLLEIKGRSVRIKRRGMPEVYVPLDDAAEVARFLLMATGQQENVATA